MNTEPLDHVAEFLYLVRKVAYNNSNSAALYQNMRKSRRRCVMVGKVVTKMGKRVRSQGIMYKTALKLVLLNRKKS